MASGVVAASLQCQRTGGAAGGGVRSTTTTTAAAATATATASRRWKLSNGARKEEPAFRRHCQSTTTMKGQTKLAMRILIGIQLGTSSNEAKIGIELSQLGMAPLNNNK